MWREGPIRARGRRGRAQPSPVVIAPGRCTSPRVRFRVKQAALHRVSAGRERLRERQPPPLCTFVLRCTRILQHVGDLRLRAKRLYAEHPVSR